MSGAGIILSKRERVYFGIGDGLRRRALSSVLRALKGVQKLGNVFHLR